MTDRTASGSTVMQAGPVLEGEVVDQVAESKAKHTLAQAHVTNVFSALSSSRSELKRDTLLLSRSIVICAVLDDPKDRWDLVSAVQLLLNPKDQDTSAATALLQKQFEHYGFKTEILA